MQMLAPEKAALDDRPPEGSPEREPDPGEQSHLNRRREAGDGQHLQQLSDPKFEPIANMTSTTPNSARVSMRCGSAKSGTGM
jgi:hypothetical protein